MDERVLKNCPPCETCGIRDGVLVMMPQNESICPPCHQQMLLTIKLGGTPTGINKPPKIPEWAIVKRDMGEKERVRAIAYGLLTGTVWHEVNYGPPNRAESGDLPG